MLSLTAEQGAFALHLAEGETQAEAYRHAYSAKAMGTAAVWPEASRLANHPKVSARVQELKADAEEMRRAAFDRVEAIIQRLELEAPTARTDGARLKSLELLGKHLGMFTDHVVVDTQERTEEEVEQAILGGSPDWSSCHQRNDPDTPVA